LLHYYIQIASGLSLRTTDGFSQRPANPSEDRTGTKNEKPHDTRSRFFLLFGQLHRIRVKKRANFRAKNAGLEDKTTSLEDKNTKLGINGKTGRKYFRTYSAIR